MLKTNRSVAKRFKFTGRKKIKRTRAYKGHLLSHKSKRRKRNLKHLALVDSRDMKQVRRLLPYG
ncbi:MAG: 50S ribosomal protein L35 [Candidatus Omnitrophica bacterium]|nr:50S ribosomal protein L35 [Candidatus Omnitrophota bacterium]